MARMLVIARSAADAVKAAEGGADALMLAPGPGDDPWVRAICETPAPPLPARCPIVLLCSDGAKQHLEGWSELCHPDEIFVPLGSDGLQGRMHTPRRGGVLNPDEGREEHVFDLAASQGFESVLLGDAKEPRRLLETFSAGDLHRHVRWARKRQLAIGFGGRMDWPDVPRLLALDPDFLVVDEIVRDGGQESGAIDPKRICTMRDLVPQHGHVAPPRGGGEIDGRGDPDQIFVHDWTVSMLIGAYAHERTPQRVRFTVDVDIIPATGRAADMRDVVTYDLITDAISRATVDRVDLVETIAEDVAAMILVHPRVCKVDIAVEKLDLGPGSLGCRIIRGRRPLEPSSPPQ